MRGKKYRLLFLLALLCTIALAVGGTASADPTIIVVKPSTPGWLSIVESGPSAAGSFVTGPDTPPHGIGSIFMKTPDFEDGFAVLSPQFLGTKLTEITKLEYSTYRSAGSPAPLIALQFAVDYDPTDLVTAWQGRLVFEPYLPPAPFPDPASNVWQTWNPMDGLWWATGGAGAALCPQANPCWWHQVTTHWPQARIHPDLGQVLVKAGSKGSWTGFAGNVDKLTIGINGTDTIFDFEPETACTDTCYVNAATGNDAFGGDSPTSAKKTIQAAVNAVAVNGDVIIAAGTYNEQVSVNKDGLTITGAGPTDTLLVSPVACTGSTVGIKLLGSHTGTTLSGFSVSGYDIGLHIGQNIGFTVTDLSITNVSASNNCIHGIWSQAGTTNGLLVDDITASNNGTLANFGRGLWLINGHKEDITIQNSTFNSNGLVGIDISDGDVTGTNITGNTVSGNGDSGIGVLGPEGPDDNFVTNNLVSNNGRFGIEIKNPSGSTTVSGNTVSLTVLPTVLPAAAKDYAGIAVFRRFPNATYNADQPSGVAVTGNSISGYTNPANSGEGFGILVEGTGMTVTNNTVSGNDIGIQVQEKNPDPISPETTGTPFFDRGNASIAAIVAVNYNNITGNLDFGVRAVGTTNITDATLNWWNTVNGPGPVGPGTGDKVSAKVDFCPWLDGPFDGGGSVIELVKNIDTPEVFCTIQSAIDDSDTSPGDTIQVAAHTFVEQVDDHKGVILVGAGAGSSFIKAPATIPGGGYIVSFTSGGSSEISDFTITGPGQVGCLNSMGGGIFVRDGSTANIYDNTISAIRDPILSGCQNGVAIRVGSSAPLTTGSATIKNNLIEDFQKNGITVSGTGSSATIEENTVNGAGPTTLTAQNGIQFSSGTSGSAKNNQITGIYYTGNTNYVAAGILTGGDVTAYGNTLTDTQVGIYHFGGTSTYEQNIINAKDYFAEIGWGAYGVIAWGGKADIIGNTLTGDEGINTWGIEIYDDTTPPEVSATKNIVSKFTAGFGVYGTNFANVDINRNSITSNGDGMVNYDTYPIDGTCNWWGAADGPSTVGPGSGDTVSANVDFLPWLLTDELDGPCLGGYPQLVIEKKVISGTPGQVFPYELTGPAPDTFDLEHGETEILTLPYGTYTLVENIPSSWQMSDIVCYETIGGDRIPITNQVDFTYVRDPLTNLAYGITFTLDEDEAGIEPIYCVFEQLEIPDHIIIKKIVEPGGNTNTAFDYHLTGTKNYDFDLKHGEMEIIPLTVPGSYQIVEDVPFGWQMTDLRCKEANGLELPVPTPGGDFAYIRDSNNLAYGFTFERGNGLWEPVYCEYKQKQLNGKLTVKKDTQNPSSSLDDFQFTVSGGSTAIAPFDLDDSILTPGKPSSKTFPVLSDYYTVTETPEAGWHLTSITCAAKSGQGDVSYTPNLATYSVVVGIGGGQEVTCTFVNQKGSVISATKYNDKNKDGDIDLLHGELRLGGWEFTLYSADGTTVVAGPITTDNGGLDKGSANFTNVPAGTYLLCETDDRVPSLWTNTQPATIYDPPNAPCYQVTVGYHDLAIKFFGNYEIPKADLVVTKTDSPDPIALGSGDITYTIKVKNEGPDTAKNVTLVDTLPANVTFVSSVPSSPTCVYDSGPDTVTCDLGNIGDDDTEVVTITVTPTETGEVENSATATSTTNDPNPTNNTDDETTTVTQPLPTTGKITVVKNWSSPGDLSFPSLVDAPQFNFGFGPISSETSFDLPAAPAGINGSASTDFVREPGVYRLYESPESGWAMIEDGVTNHEAVCTGDTDDGTTVTYNLSASLDIDLKAGDHVTCTFTNELITYDFTVTKELADGAATPGSDWQFAIYKSNVADDNSDDELGENFTLAAAGGSKTFVVPTAYWRVDETVQTGYDLISVTCEPGGENILDPSNDDVEILVQSDNECTFLNDEKEPEPTTGKITVVKNWSSPGDLSFPSLVDAPQFNFGFGPISSETSFDLPAAPAGINGSASTDFVREPGVYRLYESPESGWAMIEDGVTNHEAVCIGDTDDGTIVTYNLSASLDIDLKAGDHVTCTFTNELITYDFTVTKELADGAAVPGSDWDFDIYLSNSYETDADDEFAESFTLPAAGGSKTFVVPTAYWHVDETVQTGYDLISVTCEPGGENILDPSNDDVEILVQSDNECTFLNDEGEPEPAPTLTVTKSDGQTSVQGETDLTYTITVKNTGNATATAVALTDELPIGVMFLSGSTDTGTCAFPAANTIINAGNKTFTCDLGNLDPDATAIITVIVDTPAVTEAKDLTNKACAEAENADKACASDTTTVTPPGNVCANGGDWRKDLKHNQSKLLEIGNDDSGETVVAPGYYIGQVKNINKSGQNCTYLVGLASYAKFDEIIDNQILMDWDWPRYVGPNETIFLRVAKPECAQQIDLFYGDILWSLDGQRYGNRLLDWHHVLGKQYCAAIRAKKVTEPAGDAQNFDFSIPQLGENFSLADGGVSEWFVYNPGGYGLVQVNEAFVDGWTVDNGAGKSACKTQTNAFANYLFQAPLNPGDPTGFDVTPVAGEKVTCKFVNVKDAKLTIVKKLVTSQPQDGTQFSFEISGEGGSIATPLLIGGGSHPESLPAGTYTVTETPVDGYVFGKVECSNGASSTEPSVEVTLLPGDDVTCTFINKAKATVTIFKDVTSTPNPDTEFEFSTTLPGGFAGLLGHGDSQSFSGLTQDSYTVTETLSDEWELDNIVCERSNGDAYPHYSVDLANGELSLDIKWGDNVECTFYNLQYRLEIQKSSDPEYDASVYFDSTTLPDINGGDPGRFDMNGIAGIERFDIKPGVYDITELVPDGYVLDEVTCNGLPTTITDNTVTIDLTAGDVTCIFKNVGVGSIKVIKDVADGENTQDFTFGIDRLFDAEGNPDNQDIADFNLDDDADGTLSNTSEVYEVPLGTYVISESAVSGWSATITCVDLNDQGWNSYSPNDNPQPYVQFNVELGQEIVCTFVNSYTPPTYDLTIQKSSDPGYDAQVYFSSSTIPDVNGADPGNFSVNGMDGQYTFENLESGIYDATEFVPDGYVLDHVTCNQVDVTITNNGVSIDLTQGDVICVFYNVEESDDVPGCIKSNPERKDCSSMSVEEASCEAGVAHFVVKNTGDPGEGDVNPAYPLEYRIYVDDVLVETGYVDNFPGGTTKTFKYEGGGSKIVFEIDQQIGHPGNSYPNGKVENCFPPQTNEPPKADISGELTKTLACNLTQDTFYLDASGSSDGDGFITTYVWSNGDVDNNQSTQVTMGAGTQDITLTVTDDDGAQDTLTVTLTMLAAPPQCFPPTSVGEEYYGLEDSGPVMGNVLDNDIYGGDPSEMSVQSLGGGHWSPNTDGTFSFEPGPNEFGTYPAPYQACALFCGNTVNATIHILPVNDEPSFGLSGNLEVNQGSGAQEYVSFAYDVTAGAGEDLDQQLTFELVPTGDAIFDSPPTIIYNTSSFSWHLLFTPSSTTSGTATIQVTLKDNGGTDNGGDDTSETKSFTITVLPPLP